MAATPVEMVRVRMGRALDAAELALVVALLDEAESRVRADPGTGDVTARLTQDALFRANFTATAANAVVRVLRNPEAVRQEGVGPYSWSYDTRAAAGFLTILEDEMALLTVGPGSSSATLFVIPAGPAMPRTLPPAWGGLGAPLGNADDASYWGDLS